MFWTIIGWVLWGLVALFTIVQLFYVRSRVDRDAGFFSGIDIRRVSNSIALLLSAALIATAFTTVSKWHLVWVAPLVFFGSMIMTWMNFRKQFKRAWRSNFIERGELANFPVVGLDMSWMEIVRQVFIVLEFDTGKTTVDADGIPKRASDLHPYGFLLARSPMFGQPISVPIVHKDDFILAAVAFGNAGDGEVRLGNEILATYAPSEHLTDGRSANHEHVMHYIICPKGTLKAYYEFNEGIHKSRPNLERLFGLLAWAGPVDVRHNLSPNLT